MKLKNIYSLFLILATLLCSGNVWGETLTVADGTSLKQRLPMYGYYGDEAQHNQFVFLSSELSDMNGGTITALTFYMDKNYTWRNNNAPTATFRFAEVTATSVATLIPVDETFQQVFSGTIVFANNEWNITLNEAYTYNGGNLLIDVQTTAAQYINNNSNKGSYFYSANVAYGRGNYNGSSAQEYIPKTTFTYDAPSGGCPKPKTLTKSADLPDGATFTWEQNVDETTYQWACVTSGEAVTSWNTLAENVRTKTITGLTAGTAYDFHVRSYCGDGENEQSASVKINFTPTCPAPSYPTTPVTNKTHNSATVTWNAAEGISKYQYVCVAQGTTPVWTGVEAKAVTSVDLSGLAELTNYDFYVRSWYSETAQSAAQKTSFQTTADCSAKTIDAEHPWTENFTNQTTSAMPLCWTAAGYDGAVYVASSSSYITFSYGKALYFTGSGNAYAYAILPDFTNDLNTLQITFSHVEESSTKSGQIQFGYYKDATFTPLHTCAYSTSSSAWRDEAAIVITGVPTGAKLAFGYKPNQSSYTAAVDNISISLYEAPACAAPTALAVSEIGTNSAKVTWNSEATDFALEYKKTSDANWTAATGTIASPFVLSGLAANETEYTVRVKAICGETPSDWVELETPFETKCQANTLGWAEDFDGLSALPACWAAGAFGSGNGQWNIYNNDARFNARTNADVDLTTPEITLSEAAQLQFHHTNSSATASVYVKEGENDPVFLADIAKASSSKLQTCNLTDYTGKTVKIIFRAHGYSTSSTTYFYLEDVTVIAKPCAVPTITAANATSTGAVVTWTAGDDEGQWNLQYREIAEPENSWNLVEDVTTGYEITGLTVGHNYEVQVQAYCDATHQSAWTASAYFTPVCGAAPTALTVSARSTNAATFTWEGAEEAFKLQTSLDGETWEDAVDVNAKTYELTSLTAGTTYYARVQNACGGEYATTSFTTWCDAKDAAELPLNIESFTAVPECWEINFDGEYSGISSNKIFFYGAVAQMAVLPAYDIELNKLSVTFGFSTNSANLEFGYLEEPNGAFHAFASQPATGVELNLENEVAAVKYIAIRYSSTSAYASGSISSVLVRKTPTCAKPVDVIATPAVGAATIDWTSEAAAWNVQYKPASAADWTEIAVSEKPYQLSGLEQGVSYKVRVQAACAGEDLSDWSEEVAFTTNCDAIDALPFIETFDAALSNCWNITDDETGYYAHSVYGGALNLPGGKAASGHLVVLPEITASLTNAVLTIEYTASTDANTATPQVGYIDGEFQELVALEKSNTATEARVSLATADGHRLALRYDDGTSEGTFAIREIRILEQLILADNADNTALLSANMSKTLDVTVERTLICDGDYNTICLPFDLPSLDGTPLEGATVKAFKYAVIEPEELQVRVIDVEDGLEAGVPYLIKFAAGENIVNPLFKNVTIGAIAAQAIGQDQPVEFIGSFAPVAFVGGDQSTLFVHTNNTLTWSAANSNLKAFRAYFHRTSNPSAAPLRPGMAARIVEHEEMTTGMEDIQPSAISSQKVLENGQVVIIRNGVKYTIQGQVIEK